MAEIISGVTVFMLLCYVAINEKSLNFFKTLQIFEKGDKPHE